MGDSNIIKNFGKALVPKSQRLNLIRYVAAAGFKKPPYSFFSFLFFFSLLITIFIFYYFDIYSFISHLSPLVLGFAAFGFFLIVGSLVSAIVMGAVYFYLNLQIYNRTKKIEDKLGDFLVLVSTNLKGGLNFEESLWRAIKPEFGILSEEMGYVSKKVMTGSDLNDALKEFSEKYDSPLLKRTFNIISGELDSGGQIAYVLDDIIKNIRKTHSLKEEMSASTTSFTIFIGVIVMFISPLLFALAYNLLNVLIDVSGLVGTATASTGGADIGFGGGDFDSIELDPELFRTFSALALGLISLVSSMIVSIIQKGDIKGGIKYLPFFLFTTLIMYFMFMNALDGAFDIL